MRLFVAAKPPLPLCKHVEEVMAPLKKVNPAVRWIPPDNLHFTLKFIGEIPPERLESIIQTLKNIHAKPLELQLVGIGCFPNVHRARVVWVGVQGSVGDLTHLAALIDRSIAKACGIDKEKRPFRPHLTVARLRNPPTEELKRAIIEKKAIEIGESFCINTFELMKSTLRTNGAEYSIVKSFPLQG
jgi:RNA 2',3'-cyclic 3'-phosphodiesterase